MASQIRADDDACMSDLRTTLCRSAAVFFGLALCSSTFSLAQTAARIQGQATDAAGRPLSNAAVRLISDQTYHSTGRPWRYTLVGDSLGKYSQEGIAPGAYLVMLFTDGKGTSVSRSVYLKAGGSSVINLDLKPQLQVAGTSGGRPGTGAHLRAGVQTR